MTRVLLALALTGFREALRNRVTVVVAAFALVMILLTTVVMNITIFSLDRVVTDFGLGVMSLLLTGLAIFTSVGLLNREIERRTVFLVVSRPLSRGTFIVGRYLGLIATLTALQTAMCAVYGLQLAFFDVPVTPQLAYAIGGLWLQLLMVSGLGLLFSSFSGAVTSSVGVLCLYLAGQWTADLYALSEKFEPLTRAAARALYWILPNFGRLDFKMHAASAMHVDAAYFWQGVVGALAWAVLFVTGATVFFSRRDFK